MSLIKVKITVRSTVINAGDPEAERSDESYIGYMRYSEGEGVIRLQYKHRADGASTETVIEPQGSALMLRRRGAIDSNMLFELGVSHHSLYKIPPYSFDMALTARRIDYDLTPLGGTVALDYHMNVGGCEKECSMRLTAVPV